VRVFGLAVTANILHFGYGLLLNFGEVYIARVFLREILGGGNPLLKTSFSRRILFFSNSSRF